MREIALKDNELAIVIIGFDGYKDVWEHFFTLFHKFWPDNPYPVYLVNEQGELAFDGVTVIHCGADAQWSKKAYTACGQIESKYICLLLEDFFLGKEVSTKLIQETLEYIVKEQIRYYKLTTFSKIKTESYKGNSHLFCIPENLDYGISLQAAIWDREFLKATVGPENYNAWTFEANQLKESKQRNSKELLAGCVFDNRNILNICHAIVQSKYLPAAITYFKKIGYQIDTTVRPQMKGKAYLVYRFKRLGGFVPKSLKNGTKKVMRLFGMKFVSDQHK